ncbi:MAG: glycosyltransferase family 4 protein [Anaerolineae bacterium]|nr:glycosyltransferase family 4 protein [Anaerolineae bacterium]MDH7474484.1 glycosyltransferase family 4 protein [Anaerolineae bacterium]
MVDVDDPRFTPYETRMLNHPHVRAVVTTTYLLRERLIRNGVRKDVLVMPQGVSFKDKNGVRQAEIARQYRGHGEVVIGLSQPLLSIAALDDKSKRKTWPDEYSMKFLLEVMEHVWSEIPHAELWLLGRPHHSLVRYAQTRPAIKLMGYIPRRDLLNYVANFDIAVYPRQVDFEGRFSVKLIEYMGCGVPIVSTNVGESFIVTEAKSGLIASDVKGFADALIRLCRDPALRHELGENGRRFAVDYDWDAIAMRYEQDVFERYFGPSEA